jgi:hypothetical protein
MDSLCGSTPHGYAWNDGQTTVKMMPAISRILMIYSPPAPVTGGDEQGKARSARRA